MKKKEKKRQQNKITTQRKYWTGFVDFITFSQLFLGFFLSCFTFILSITFFLSIQVMLVRMFTYTTELFIFCFFFDCWLLNAQLNLKQRHLKFPDDLNDFQWNCEYDWRLRYIACVIHRFNRCLNRFRNLTCYLLTII